MTDSIKPALTPEEWGFWFTPVAGDAPRIQLWRLLADRENHHSGNLHKIAALALLNHGEYGIKYGFTHEDVRELRFAAEKVDPGGITGLASLADRIEALLPPEEK